MGTSTHGQQALRLILFEKKLIARAPDGRRVLVRASASNVRTNKASALSVLARNRTCLGVLKGLAVPELVELNRKELCRLVGRPVSGALVVLFQPGRPLDKAGLSPRELLGAWCFLIEQLVAFRRCQILYADIRCLSVRAMRRPLRVVVSSFDGAVLARPSRNYPGSELAFTAGFEAPEHSYARRLTERSLVYQLGMLLPHCLAGMDNSSLTDPERGRRRLRKVLESAGAPALAPLLAACLSPKPDCRPADYQELLREILRLGRGLPAQALATWRSLREPYAGRLRGLGLRGELGL